MMTHEALVLSPGVRQTLNQQFGSIVNFLSHPAPARALYYCLMYQAPSSTAALDESLSNLWRN